MNPANLDTSGDPQFQGPVPVSPYYQAMMDSLMGQPSLHSYVNQVAPAVGGTMPGSYIGYGGQTQGPGDLGLLGAATAQAQAAATPGAPGGIASGLRLPTTGIQWHHPAIGAFLAGRMSGAGGSAPAATIGRHGNQAAAPNVGLGSLLHGLFGGLGGGGAQNFEGGPTPNVSPSVVPNHGWNLADTLLGHGAGNLY